MGQLASIITNVKTLVAATTTARDGTTNFADASSDHDWHADDGEYTPPGEARFYVHCTEPPQHTELISASTQWVEATITVYVGQQERGASWSVEEGIMSDNVSKIVSAVETGTGYPSGTRGIFVAPGGVEWERREGLIVTRIPFVTQFSETY